MEGNEATRQLGQPAKRWGSLVGWPETGFGDKPYENRISIVTFTMKKAMI
jgi:hypothetical protein